MPETTDLIITQTIDAPVERVWNAWVSADIMQQWWGPDGFGCPSANMDVRVGGTSVVAMRAPEELGGQDSYSSFAYTVVTPHRQLEFIHNLCDQSGEKIDPQTIGMPADFPQDMRQAVVFKDLGGGRTEVVVTEYGWPVGQMRDMSELGMKQCLDKMATALQESK